MKQILVLSDSHGNLNNMVLAVKRVMPDMIIHLGDCWADAERLRKKFPDIPMEQVPGNCDCRQEFQERELLIEGKRILICHGHTLNVKAGYMNLKYSAEQRQVDAALFGHTLRVLRKTQRGYLSEPGQHRSPGAGSSALLWNPDCGQRNRPYRGGCFLLGIETAGIPALTIVSDGSIITKVKNEIEEQKKWLRL